MRLESTNWQLSQLVSQISTGAVRLPEVQRGYVWKPIQVASFVDSLYRGYPIGSLLFWRSDVQPLTREADIDAVPGESGAPLYLLDGQQRLTSLHRVFNDHDQAQIVFNVETERFQNQSSSTVNDVRWVKVFDIVDGRIDLFELTFKLSERIPELDRNDIHKRLARLEKTKERTVYLEILGEFEYEEVSEIFIRVNSGRPLKRMDLALATLSARRPGTLAQLESEAAHWAERGWGDLDLTFLARALTAAVLGRGLTPASNKQLLAKSDAELDAGWRTVQRGLRHLVPLLKENLGVTHSSLLKSVVVLLPLVVLLGERSDEPMESETADAILYWFLAATLRNRYSGSTDTKLGQDIPDARKPDGVNRLLDRLGLPDGRLEVTPRDLVDRSSGSPYFMMSFLAAKSQGAHDWWSGAAVSVGAEGGHKLEYHHVFPQALLRRSGEYTRTEINDLANLVFIAGRANRGIGAKRPNEYLAGMAISDDELLAHSIPDDRSLWEENRYRAFLARRRELLSGAMNAILDRLRPQWLVRGGDTGDPMDGLVVDFTYAVPEGGEDQLHVEVQVGGQQWEGVCEMTEIYSVLQDASLGLNSELMLSGTRVAVSAGDDDITIPMGPVRISGSKEEWQKTLTRIENEIEYPDQPLTSSHSGWDGPIVDVQVTAVV
ncbi:GmrSD restriction endonuclease domain-containing protein [Glycomyces harbinensis]|uniref:GmrSD restriction endonucleases N-terminal domain-containing protein n=1 Tax=Glycomyces harbinensis TaxID=58114 RepID=A0A1G6ZX99_9ACTN|nr:DUF262 domain-containing protein [Glycomyces harbinensis]SDE07189.1 hypothetical protein SAMN05216270_11214 [Glycomyces harbinensis]